MRVQLKRLEEILNQLRTRKRTMAQVFLESGFSMILAADPEGDCGTTLHLDLGDPAKAVRASELLLQAGVPAAPLFVRPAHCFWQWSYLLEPGKDGAAEMAMEKMELSSILKIPVDFQARPEELAEKAQKTGQILLKI